MDGALSASASTRHLRSHSHRPTLALAQVTGAASDADARVVAKSVAGSSLAKAAIFGGDPNWGRIAAAAGYSGGCAGTAACCCALQRHWPQGAAV